MSCRHTERPAGLVMLPSSTSSTVLSAAVDVDNDKEMSLTTLYIPVGPPQNVDLNSTLQFLGPMHSFLSNHVFSSRDFLQWRLSFFVDFTLLHPFSIPSLVSSTTPIPSSLPRRSHVHFIRSKNCIAQFVYYIVYYD